MALLRRETGSVVLPATLGEVRFALQARHAHGLREVAPGRWEVVGPRRSVRTYVLHEAPGGTRIVLGHAAPHRFPLLGGRREEIRGVLREDLLDLERALADAHRP